MLFEVLEDRYGDWIVLSIIGELDLGTAPRVRHAVLRALAGAEREAGTGETSGPVRLVLDLGSVDFIDSSGLGIVIGTLRRVRAAGGDLAVVVVDPAREVFIITGLDRVLPLGKDLHSAIAAADQERVAGRTREGDRDE